MGGVVRGQWEVKMPAHWFQSLCCRRFPAFGVKGVGKSQKLLETKLRRHHPIAIDGLEVVLHGDDGIAVLAPFLLTLGSLGEVGMVALIIVWQRIQPAKLIILHQ